MAGDRAEGDAGACDILRPSHLTGVALKPDMDEAQAKDRDMVYFASLNLSLEAWCRGLTRCPVKAETAGSNPVASEISEYRSEQRAVFFLQTKADRLPPIKVNLYAIKQCAHNLACSPPDARCHDCPLPEG